ncbi:MAG: hypothetical protein A3C49_02900 [Candidatus Doudnabacteria bacterium RIFCSPHIGHO2_02_FULL_42_25]|uniref:Phosphoribosylaminoimidazole-succinocarboxamide synthase n=1 Tax=Candidatus Doudnabacteria bacterium RIFCSPHIGHO2_01_FULL_41_86 TaxID=1817821 RepID=A0A1F5N9P6_9BACT|nr:MAG: hypothetical protein A2717_02495 [Candidatus Doudnabacteria bacterium RIFCSPHIGHO2_01_FULL_41_86]OGE85426.1 MAG: hypothetical protein A3E28_02065 [Candidatus Doudnabacteria bacterium RIFCSPHIGHO2_12_FULL_42_22]OGE86964.1 MAG: hypothetical protein A3C49_02900 [Candidatus Doudnabacteria bacterium RIFCSPHIGHO2_02_FULL_42_25]OGE92563.1 MAG: hypothetical protein A2895_03055 [Candidatus Doudnabacteria bacterium RIFCSPLOWO2_01_FULL_42_60]
MPYIPERVRESEVTRELLHAGVRRAHQGKVRDTFELRSADHLLVVASDRISIFDFVLDALVEGKGEVLTKLVVFWLTTLFKNVPNHLVAHGKDIDEFLPKHIRNYAELHQRAIVVQKQEMRKIEAIVRGYLTGSGWKDYQATGAVCGIELPAGLHDGSKLPEPIFTPSTKSEDGHDVNISEAEAIAMIGQTEFKRIQQASLADYRMAYEYALPQGIIIADTKFEFGAVLADEVLTPDSSRFWDTTDYALAKAKKQSPVGYDKQPVRDAGKKASIGRQIVDISKLDPKKQADRELAASWVVPEYLLQDCIGRCRKIQHRLTQPAYAAS